MRTCSKCGKEYPATTEYFYSQKNGKYGLASWCKPCQLEYNHQWQKDNPEKCLNARRRRYAANPQKYQEYNREWVRTHRDRQRTNARNGARRWRAEARGKLSHTISRGIWSSLVDGKGGKHWEDLVGYTLNDLIEHIGNQFTNGMCWGNYGFHGWHIDHIKPISHFDFSSPDDPEFLECWSLWNLQPLWARDNFYKTNKCEAPPLPLLHGKDEK